MSNRPCLSLTGRRSVVFAFHQTGTGERSNVRRRRLGISILHCGCPLRLISGLVVGELLVKTRVGKGLDRGTGRGPSVRGAIDRTGPSVDQVATGVGCWRGAVLSVALGQWIAPFLFSWRTAR